MKMRWKAPTKSTRLCQWFRTYNLEIKPFVWIWGFTMLRVHKCWICPCAAISEHTAVLAYTNIIGFRWNVPATSISDTPEWAQNPGTPFGWMRALGSRHTLTSTSGGPAGFASSVFGFSWIFNWEKGWWSFGSWTQLFLNWNLPSKYTYRISMNTISYLIYTVSIYNIQLHMLVPMFL